MRNVFDAPGGARLLIVDRVLTEDPTFGDFQDIKASPAFASWRAANR